MSEHWWLVANCKSEGCSAFVRLAYLGAKVPESIGLPFVPYKCDSCGDSHHYTLASKRAPNGARPMNLGYPPGQQMH